MRRRPPFFKQAIPNRVRQPPISKNTLIRQTGKATGLNVDHAPNPADINKTHDGRRKPPGLHLFFMCFFMCDDVFFTF
jgi:hypothetical protein